MKQLTILLAGLLAACVAAPPLPPPPPQAVEVVPGALDASFARSAALDGAVSALPGAGPVFQRQVTSEAGPIAVSGLTLPDSVFFDFGIATPRPDAAPALDALARAIRASPPDSVLTVAGNTDDIGSPRFNQSLSGARARAVVAALVARGLSASRLAAVGFGATRPIASNDDEAGRARNRRVELALSPSFAANAALFTSLVPVTVQPATSRPPPGLARRPAALDLRPHHLEPVQRNTLGPPVSY